MRATITLLAAIAAFAPQPALAQVATAPGDRVRMETPDGSVLVGVVSTVSAESIMVRPEGTRSEVEIPLTELGRVERSLGSQRRVGKSIVVTMAVGAGAIGLGSALSWSPCNETGLFACFLHPESRGQAFSWGFVGGALAGVPVGLLIGLATKSEQWEPLSVPGTRDATVSFVPLVGARLGVAGSISFGGR